MGTGGWEARRRVWNVPSRSGLPSGGDVVLRQTDAWQGLEPFWLWQPDGGGRQRGLLLASGGERLGVRGTPCGARDGPNKGLPGLEVLLQTGMLCPSSRR